MKSANFSQLIQKNLVLVHFEADWCGPCKTQNEILNQIKINNLDINNLNIEKNPLLTKIYEISALPTLILFRDGEIIWQKTGLVSELEINSAVGSFIQVLNC